MFSDETKGVCYETHIVLSLAVTMGMVGHTAEIVLDTNIDNLSFREVVLVHRRMNMSDKM